MSLNTTIQALKAAADPTRLRLLALLANGEATVGELQEILDQSQPRVSRHLRVLGEAGLVAKFRDGHWVYYRLGSEQETLVAALLTQLGQDDAQISADRIALDRVKQNREREYFDNRRPSSSGLLERPTEAHLAAALDDCLMRHGNDGTQLGSVLDIGCGSGTLLRLLANRADRIVGLDRSRPMRLLARSRLHRDGVANGTVRQGELTHLPFADDSFDLVILDEVLTDAEDVRAGILEALRVLKADGQLLIADRVHPVATRLPQDGVRQGLFENQLKTLLAELGWRIDFRLWFPGRVMEFAWLTAVSDGPQQRTGTYD